MAFKIKVKKEKNKYAGKKALPRNGFEFRWFERMDPALPQLPEAAWIANREREKDPTNIFDMME